MAAVLSPGFPISLIGAIPALRALSDPTVRAAFGRSPGPNQQVLPQVFARPAATQVVFWLFWVIASVCWLGLMLCVLACLLAFELPRIRNSAVVAAVLLALSAIGAYGAWPTDPRRSYGWAVTSVTIILVVSLIMIPVRSYEIPVPPDLLVHGWNDVQAYILWGGDEYDRSHWISLTLTLE